MRTRLLLFSLLLLSLCAKGADIPVTTTDFASKYNAANNNDVLLLATGTYNTAVKIPSGKAITLKAADGASPILNFEMGADAGISGGSIIFDGITINRGGNNNYFISFNGALSVDKIEFRNCNITGINRCLVNAGGTGTVNEMTIDNTIVGNNGTGYCFIYFNSAHVLKNLTVSNSTIYNYGGEHLFWGRAKDNTNAFTFLFEHNTVYNFSKNSTYAFCKVEEYAASSTYTLQNNIINGSGTAGQSPYAVSVGSGSITSQKNLVVETSNFNTAPSAGWTTKDDYTLSDFSLTSVGFPDPSNGVFTIPSTSPLTTASTTGGIIGDPRWLNVVSAPAQLSTIISPTSSGSVSPASGTFNQGESVTLTAANNFGYRFKEWQIGGVQQSTENPFTFAINADTEVTAVFEAIDTYTLTVDKTGDGATWGKITLNPEPVDGKYETGTNVTMTVVPNSIATFNQWDDASTSLTRQITMDGNKTASADFDWVPFIVGWDFDAPEPRTNREGDFYHRAENKGAMKFFKGDGSSTSWGSNTRTFDGVTYTAARRYTEAANMTTSPRYFQAEFSAKAYQDGAETMEYKNIQIKSYIAADNDCVHKKQKIEYATNATGPYTSLATIEIPAKNQWVEFNATLPSSLSETDKENLYIRWTPDLESELFGTPKENDTEGFYLANVFITATVEKMTTSITADSYDQAYPVAVVSGDILTIKNVKPGDAISLYSVDGCLIYQGEAAAVEFTVPVSSKKGVHILKVGGYSFKIML
ncbi:DUF4957 domain-containing protein [Dysgonomonas sp. 520]|uniref:InlB B-repeat-containing protein n=1 Tax=Dysgonomonas sp. 520 TaxID=2302931 RepID=UPI0013D1E49E|nr:DUF4957 domain-containing protein [Dysgonomonas sp. 520]